METHNGDHIMLCPMCKRKTKTKWHLDVPGIDMMVCVSCHTVHIQTANEGK